MYFLLVTDESSLSCLVIQKYSEISITISTMYALVECSIIDHTYECKPLSRLNVLI